MEIDECVCVCACRQPYHIEFYINDYCSDSDFPSSTGSYGYWIHSIPCGFFGVVVLCLNFHVLFQRFCAFAMDFLCVKCSIIVSWAVHVRVFSSSSFFCFLFYSFLFPSEWVIHLNAIPAVFVYINACVCFEQTSTLLLLLFGLIATKNFYFIQ